MFDRDHIHPYTPIRPGTIKVEDYFNRRTGCIDCGRPKQPGDALYCAPHRAQYDARGWDNVSKAAL